ncbi:MAG TPA: 2TM domain-containing protein [Solirubrobacteraceae bacterium]|nr:2TM domain-containing protein [Solirubrobacteraceae bacterium]
MTSEVVTKNGRPTEVPTLTAEAREDAELREWARDHVERVRRLKLHVAVYVVGMLVLTPVWALTQWQDNGAFKRFDFTPDGTPGDWEPWILYVVLIWGGILALQAVRTYFDRPTTRDEIERTILRVKRST